MIDQEETAPTPKCDCGAEATNLAPNGDWKCKGCWPASNPGETDE